MLDITLENKRFRILYRRIYKLRQHTAKRTVLLCSDADITILVKTTNSNFRFRLSRLRKLVSSKDFFKIT